MLLTGLLLECTQQAIVDSFGRHELDQFVRIRLDENFEAIVRDDNLRVQAYELLLWAGRHGREQELLDKLTTARPHNTDFAAVAEALRTGASLPPERNVHSRRPASGSVPLQKPLRTQHFIGRATELAMLLENLQPGRTVTLCGPGGMGKSTLAAEAVWTLAPAADAPERFPDGIIFHSFYHQPQASLALEAIARAYHVDPSPSARDAALRALTGKNTLLVLDGAEAADDLEAVLSVTAGCGVLITSRRHADAPDDYRDIEPLPRGESLELLRAWAGKYADDTTAANETVRLLGGLPLALFLAGRYLVQQRQLAAVFVESLQEEGLEALHFANRPSKSIPLLMARSLVQVNDTAQAAFGVVGVLALTPFDAELVAAALEITPATAHRALGELVDYGLVLHPDDDYQVTHVLAHNYARMHAAPSIAAINRLGMHFATLAAGESAQGVRGNVVLDRFRAHILAVQAVALKAEQWEVVQGITWKISDYLKLQGYWTDRVNVAKAGLDAARATHNQYDEGAFLASLGSTYAAIGDQQHALQALTDALSLALQCQDRHNEAKCYIEQAKIYWHRGDYSSAQKGYLAALSLAQTGSGYQDDFVDVASEAHYGLGLVFRQQSRYDDARSHLFQALVTAERLADHQIEARALNALGSVANVRRDFLGAMDLFAQALEIHEAIGDRTGVGQSLLSLAQTYAFMGDYSRVEPLLQRALEIHRAMCDRWDEMLELNELGILYTTVGQYEKAFVYLDQAMQCSQIIASKSGAAYIMCNLGQAQRDAGLLEVAQHTLQKGLLLAQQQGDILLEAIYLSDVALSSLLSGQYEESVEQAKYSLALFEQLQQPLSSTGVYATLAGAYFELGSRAAAEQAAQTALAILDGCGGEGPDFPHRDYWLCAQIFGELGQTETARHAVEQARTLLRQRAERISDATLRHAYLTQVAVHADIIAAS